jgi:hypothetical protein
MPANKNKAPDLLESDNLGQEPWKYILVGSYHCLPAKCGYESQPIRSCLTTIPYAWAIDESPRNTGSKAN